VTTNTVSLSGQLQGVGLWRPAPAVLALAPAGVVLLLLHHSPALRSPKPPSPGWSGLTLLVAAIVVRARSFVLLIIHHNQKFI